MNTENRLLPVPVFNQNSAVYENIKKTRKVNTSYFYLVFALYLLSTLLGSALVPGKLRLEGFAFLLAFSRNGALFICAERCFFAFFYVFFCFSRLRFPVSILFSVSSGIYMGIYIRLLIYNSGALLSVAVSFLLALQIMADVFCASLAHSSQLPSTNRYSFKRFLIFSACLLCYVLISLLLSYLISLMLK